MPKIIEFTQVSKVYRPTHGQSSLRDLTGDLLRWFRPGYDGDSGRRRLWAVRDLSFGVEAGENVALIGPNGAGKTTVLKLLSRITRPTRGRVRIQGRVASLIEVGAGIHPDLTARENIAFNGAMFGMSPAQVRERFDAIVAFSELEAYLDMPVKRFSSGMAVRLGFSIAVHAPSDILLVDEALAVGDLAFRAKSIERMLALRRERTVVFVSHELRQVESLCARALWLERGGIVEYGPTAQVVGNYLRTSERRMAERDAAGAGARLLPKAGPVRIVQTELEKPDEPGGAFLVGAPLVLTLSYECVEPLDAVAPLLWVRSPFGPVLEAGVGAAGRTTLRLERRGRLRFRFERLPLVAGFYYLCLEFRGPGGDSLHQPQDVATIRMVDSEAQGQSVTSGTHVAAVRVECQFEHLAG